MLSTPARVHRLLLLLSLTILAATASTAFAAPPPPVGTGHSGWAWGNPTPQGETLQSLEFAGGTGYASGDFGTVLRTRDAGATWTALPAPTNKPLIGVRAVTANEVVVWTACAAWRSTSSGLTFARIPIFSKSSGCDPQIGGVAFSSSSAGTGFFVLTDGGVRETTDGGKTFTGRSPIPTTPADGGSGNVQALDVDVSSGGALLVTTGTGYQGKIFRSADQAKTWSDTANSIPPAGRVRFADATTAYALGGDALAVSQDGGETWTPRDLPDLGYGDLDLSEVGCAPGDPALCLFGTGTGVILRTTDGGKHLTRLVPSNSVVGGIGFASASGAVAVGPRGLTLTSADAGLTFASVSRSLGSAFTGIRATSSTGAAAFGSRGAIARTSDAGATWSLSQVPTNARVLDAAFSSFDVGYALLGGGGVQSTGNGGSTWAPQDGSVTGSAILAPGKSVVLVAGKRGVQRSPDGGQDFSRVGPGYALSHLDRAGAAVDASGAGHIILSTDAGKTWKSVARPSKRGIASVDFQSSKHGFVADSGGTLYATATGGKHWTALRALGATKISRVAFADAKHGWAGVSSRKGILPFGGDYLLYTANGGASFRPQVVTDQGSLAIAALAPGRAVGFTNRVDLFTSTPKGGDVAGLTSLTLKATRRKLRKSTSVRLTGHLKGAHAGDVVQLQHYEAGAWSRGAITLTRSGSFTATSSIRHAARFVVQFGGDGSRRGAGSAAVLVKR